VVIALPAPLTRLPTAPAKLRILQTADVLFSDQGIRAVGVDRLIGDSSVTKATFYKHFRSKDRLVADYIGYRHLQVAERIAALAEAAEAPAALLDALLGEIVAEIDAPGFRGDPFLNAAAEYPEHAHPVRQAVRDHRDWYLGVLEEVLRQAGHPLPGEGADELLLARDGALAGAYSGDPIAATGALARVFARVTAVAAG